MFFFLYVNLIHPNLIQPPIGMVNQSNLLIDLLLNE